ncbi:ead/Ea22-like family protein [Klebsiella quasipneumoniae]|uniref:ead/Ea22-like family protein n=1 Tax=Klebsiella quasipneumoniae TaxID=1463165 RepID=UPI002247D996|nr:ead/Ea22-like family protein [Klebsiella quasipneumoniae]MCW9409544.1 ead/Ea22-like family protein [Klebsiella quasipneumoniae]
MTDITELAQSLKAAAENAIGAHERLAAYPYGEIIDISQQEGEQIDIDITDLNEFNKEANPVNILALVEALEKAQQRIAELEQKHCGGALMERELAHSEVINKLMSEIDNRDSRIAELESRTVTVKLTDINEYLAEVHDKTLNRAFRLLAEGVRAGDVAAMRTAGIKVEAE